MKIILLQICLVILFPLLCHASDYAKAMFDAGKLDELGKAAQSGDVEAMFYFGSCYSDGIGVPKNEAEALKWYQKAAEAGGQKGMTILALMYGSGVGAPKNDVESTKWFRKLAESGDRKSMHELGRKYVEGTVVPTDLVQAYKWFDLAAARGNQASVTIIDKLAKVMTSEQILEAKKLSREWKPAPAK